MLLRSTHGEIDERTTCLVVLLVTIRALARFRVACRLESSLRNAMTECGQLRHIIHCAQMMPSLWRTIRNCVRNISAQPLTSAEGTDPDATSFVHLAFQQTLNRFA